MSSMPKATVLEQYFDVSVAALLKQRHQEGLN